MDESILWQAESQQHRQCSSQYKSEALHYSQSMLLVSCCFCVMMKMRGALLPSAADFR